MKGVAEFVKERTRVVEAEQARLALAPFREIHHIDHNRQLSAVQLPLSAELAHPGAAALRGAGEVVADEKRDRRAVCAGDRPGAGVVMIEFQVEALFEPEAEQTVRRVEGGFNHPVELQIGLDRALVEVELGLAALLGVMSPVPGRNREIAALAGHDRLQRLLFSARARDPRRPDRFEQIERGLRRLGHRVGEAVMGEGFIADQMSALGPQAHHFGGDGAIVGRPAVFAARSPGAEGLFAQVPPRGELQEGLDARTRQGDGVSADGPALGGEAGGAVHVEIRQAVEIARVDKQEPGLFVRQHVLPELCAEGREPLANRGEACLCLRRQAGAGAGEIEMVTLEHPRLFGGKPEPVLLAFQGVDPSEQRVVEIGVAAMARQNRSDLALDRLELVVGRGAGQIEEDGRHLVEAPAAALDRLDGVSEGRRLRIGGDCVDLGARRSKRDVEGGPKVLRLDTLERRRLERTGPGFEERVRFGGGLGHQGFRLAHCSGTPAFARLASLRLQTSEGDFRRRPRSGFSFRIYCLPRTHGRNQCGRWSQARRAELALPSPAAWRGIMRR